MTGGRSHARKSRRVEQELTRTLLEPGLLAVRVPLSGAAGGEFAGDLHIEVCLQRYRAEVKARRRFDTLHNWLVDADLLPLKADRQPPLAVLPLNLLAPLIMSEARP